MLIMFITLQRFTKRTSNDPSNNTSSQGRPIDHWGAGSIFVILDLQNYFLVKRESSLLSLIRDKVQQREGRFTIYFPCEA